MKFRKMSSIFLLLVIGWNFLFIPTNSIFIKHDLKKKYSSENYSQNTAINYGDKIGINTMLIYCFDLFIYDNYLFIGTTNDLKLINIENPSKPKRITTFEYCSSFSSNDYYLFAAHGFYPNEKLAYFDLNGNISKIEDVNPITYGCIKIACENNLLYAIRYDLYHYDNSTIGCFNVTRPDDVTLVSNFTIDYANIDFTSNDLSLLVKNNILYYLDPSDHLTIIDYSDPFNPNLIIKYDNTSFTNLFLTEKYLFLTTNQNLSIYNYTDLLNLKKVASYNYSELKSIFIKDKNAYLIDKESLYVFDISNLQNLKLLDKYERGKREHNDFKKIVVYNDIVCIMTDWYYTQEGGTQTPYYIFDVSNPFRIKREYPIKFEFDYWIYLGIYITLICVLPVIIFIALISITT